MNLGQIPPSIESVVQRRHELEDAIQRLAESAEHNLSDISAGGDTTIADLDLKSLSDGLSELFTLKQSGDFFDDIVQSAFHMQHAVEQLKADHQQLSDELQALRTELPSRPRKVRRRLHGWLVRFRALERREARLLQDIWNVDIGLLD